ncbi:MAG: magnesium transporter [Dehalococcoidia bacterium]|nr:magnesium transporter [Dehalococcoidia bacterium]
MQELEQAPAEASETFDALLADGRLEEAVAFARELHPADRAMLLATDDEDARRLLLSRLSPPDVGSALPYVERLYREDLLRELTPVEVADVLRSVPDDIATDVIQELPEEVAEAALTALPLSLRRQIGLLLDYGTETAGGRMTGQRIAVGPDRTVREVIEFLRSLRPDTDQPFYVYITDPANRLVGVLNLRWLITAAPETRVGSVMTDEVLSVRADADQEEAARLLKRYNLLALPVVDDAGRLLGTVTADDLLDVLEEEATEDMYRIVGVGTEEDLRGVRTSVRNRLPWLGVNLLTALLAGFIVSLFEDTIARLAVIAAFMPMVAGMGGNAGIQTVTVVVRSLALGRITPRDAWPVLRHELVVGLLIGLAIGLPVGVVGWAVNGSPALGLIVGLAMCANITNGMVTGVFIPLLLHRLGQDPAISAGIWMTTFTDVIGFLLLLGLATLFISQLT